MDLHPDRHGRNNCDERTAEFREVSEAYRILCDRHARAEYDRWLDGAEIIGADGRVVRRSRAAERNPHYRKVYSPAAPPGMKTFDRQRHFGEHYGIYRSRISFCAFLCMTRYSSDASGGRWFFFLLWKRVGEEGRRLRLPSRLPEQFAYDLDSTSTFTFSFGWNGWFWASLLASMRSDDVYLPSEKRKRPRGKSLEWPCGQGPSLRFGTRGAPLNWEYVINARRARIYILPGFGWFPSFVGASERFVSGIVAPHCADIGPSAESSDSPCVSFLPQFQCVQYNPT